MAAKRPPFQRDPSRTFRDPSMETAFSGREKVASMDRIIDGLNENRMRLGLSKAELARRIGKNQVAIRRLFTEASPNPTLATLVDVADAMNLDVKIERRQPKKLDPERNARILAEVLDLAELLPWRPRPTLSYPPLHRRVG